MSKHINTTDTTLFSMRGKKKDRQEIFVYEVKCLSVCPMSRFVDTEDCESTEPHIHPTPHPTPHYLASPRSAPTPLFSVCLVVLMENAGQMGLAKRQQLLSVFSPAPPLLLHGPPGLPASQPKSLPSLNVNYMPQRARTTGNK